MSEIHITKSHNSQIPFLHYELYDLTEEEIFTGYSYDGDQKGTETDVMGNFDVDKWISKEGHFQQRKAN